MPCYCLSPLCPGQVGSPLPAVFKADPPLRNGVRRCLAVALAVALGVAMGHPPSGLFEVRLEEVHVPLRGRQVLVTRHPLDNVDRDACAEPRSDRVVSETIHDHPPRPARSQTRPNAWSIPYWPHAFPRVESATCPSRSPCSIGPSSLASCGAIGISLCPVFGVSIWPCDRPSRTLRNPPTGVPFSRRSRMSRRSSARTSLGRRPAYAMRAKLLRWAAKATARIIPGKDPTNTERWMTYNAGHSRADVRPTALTLKSHPGNRGCMSQNGAQWLATHGWDCWSILRYFYGEDIEFHRIEERPTGLGSLGFAALAIFGIVEMGS